MNTTTQTYKFLKHETKNQISYLKLNRPEKRNALHPELMKEVTDFFNGTDFSHLKAVCISGEGKSFCVGADLEWMRDGQTEEDSHLLFDLFYSIYSCPIPVASIVQEHVFGGGLGFVACSDLCFATPNTSFCFSEIKLGLAPAVISAFVSSKLSQKQMSRFFLTGEVFKTSTAEIIELIDGSVDTLENGFKKIEDHFAKLPIEALRDTKKLVRSYSPIDPLKHKKAVIDLISKRRQSTEAQTILKKFIAANFSKESSS